MTDNYLTPEKETGKPETVPEKFWDTEKGAVRVDALLNSYLALEKKLSTMMPGMDTPEGKARALKVLGVPETPEDYAIDISHGLFETDPDVNKRLHALGFTPGQVQAVYDLAAEKLVPMIVQLADDYKADREIERLIAAFGGPEKWAETSRQLLAYGKKNFPPDVLASLASSYEGVMALHKMMKGGEAPGLSGSGPAETPGEQDLQSMMRDPRYWQKKDPAFVAKVTEGFRRMYS